MNRFIPLAWTGTISREQRTLLARWRWRLIATTRIVAGLGLLVSAGLSVRPDAISALTNILERAAHDSALIPTPWHQLWHTIAASHPTSFVWSIALIQAGAGVGLITGALTNLACTLGIALALLGWTTGSLSLVAPAGYIELAGNTGMTLIALFTCIGLSLSGAGQYHGLDRTLTNRLEGWSFLASVPIQTAEQIPGQVVTWQPVEHEKQAQLVETSGIRQPAQENVPEQIETTELSDVEQLQQCKECAECTETSGEATLQEERLIGRV